MVMADKEATAVGCRIAELLKLNLSKDGKYETSWGSKTPAGLARCVERIIKEEHNELPVAND